MLDRAYSVLNVKDINDDLRIIRGIATTPSTDRMGDVVEPLGVQFKNPLPLLWAHKSDKPVGLATFQPATEHGIKFEAKLPKIAEPGALRDRVDEAWQSIKAGLVRGVSIGFRTLEHAINKDGGYRFIKSEVLELSLVVVPANQDAQITTIRSIDSELLAATGNGSEEKDAEALAATGQPKRNGDGRPGGSGKKPIVKARKEAVMAKQTIADQIGAFENTRAAKAARMTELMELASDEGSTLDETQSQEYDTLENEVKSVDEHLVRLRRLEEMNRAAAKPIDGTSQKNGSEARAGGAVISIKSNLPPGIALTRIAIAKAISSRDMVPVLDVARQRWPTWDDRDTIMKAAVAAGTTSDTTWAAPLAPYTNAGEEFISYLWPRTIVGRLPGLTRVPFRVKVPRQTAVAAVNWVGEGNPKPVGAGAFDTVQLEAYKISGIVALTEELVRFSNPSAEALTREMLANGIVKFMDQQFLDPEKSLTTGVSPASITNGVGSTVASGTAYSNFVTDVKAVLAAFDAANIDDAGIVIVMKTSLARSMSLMLNALGQPVFPQLSAAGGTMMGYPVVTSTNVDYTEDSAGGGTPIIFIHAPSVLLADDGQVTIDISREAAVQMDSAPDSPTTASTVLVSFWQHNMVGVRAERMTAWLKARSEAVQYISAASYA